MQFKLIGPFEITTADGATFAPKAPKICQMLALLALRPRATVATETLIRELWGEDSQRGALRTLQTHVYHARKMLADAQVTSPERQLVIRESPGYWIDAADDEVDVTLFERLVHRARAALTQGMADRADRDLARALGLWRGPVLSGLSVGEVLTGRLARVSELRIRALELRVETEHRLGRHRQFLPELRALVQDHPLHEWFHGQLMLALHRAGHRGEALQAYQNLRRVLKRELGLTPSAEHQRLRAEILAATEGEPPKERRPLPGVDSDPVLTPLSTTAFAL